MPEKNLMALFRYTRCTLGVLLALLLSGAAFGLEGLLMSEESPAARSGERRFLEGPFPNSTLPDQIRVEFGKLGLFAEHDRNQPEGVPLYMVNRSSRDVEFRTYAGDPGIVLEHRDDSSGSWLRAQAGRVSMAMCGHSYHDMVLKPGQHFRIKGYRPSKGKQGTVRFRLASHELVSNEGPGVWSELDTGGGNLDSALLAEQPFAQGLVWWAIRPDGTEEKSAERVLAELELMQAWEDRAVFLAFAKAFKAEVEKSNLPQREKVQLVGAVDGLLQLRVVHDADSDGLFRRCIQILSGPLGTRFGSPGKHPEVAWEALHWLGQRKEFPHDGRWREVYQILMQRVPTADPAELRALYRMIYGNPMVHEFLPTGFLVETARSYPALMAPCVERLASLQAWSALVSVANDLDAKGKQVVLAWFCLEPAPLGAPRRLRTTYDDQQEKFWEECIESDPWRSVETMGCALGKALEGYHLEPGLSLALKDQAAKFSEGAALKPWPASDGEFQNGLRQYIRILGLQRTPKGDAILHRFLKLSETRPEGESDEQNLRRKEIAKMARQQLLISGWDPGAGGAGD